MDKLEIRSGYRPEPSPIEDEELLIPIYMMGEVTNDRLPDYIIPLLSDAQQRAMLEELAIHKKIEERKSFDQPGWIQDIY